MTIREQIKTLQEEVKGDLETWRAAEILNELSALLGNVNEALIQRQMEYNLKLAELMEGETVAKARVKADTTDEYRLLLEVKATRELTIEMMRAMKYTIKSRIEEFKEARY